MPLNECASCNHANPADAKFCNACGVALLPPWAGDSTRGFQPNLRSERGGQEAGALAAASSLGLTAALAQAEPHTDPLEPIAYAVQFDPDQTVRIGCVYGVEGLNAAANSDFDPAGADLRHLGHSAGQLAAAAVPTGDMSEMSVPGADAAAGASDASLLLRTWQRWPGAVIIGASASVAVVAFAYFGFLQYAAPDISWPAAGTSDVSARPESADRSAAARFGTGGVSEAAPPLPSGTGSAAAPLNSQTRPATPARPQPNAAPVLAVTQARGIPADALAARPIASVMPPRVGVRSAALRPQSTARNDAPSSQAAAAVARTSAQPTGSAVPSARLGPCTDAVAALGLCTPDPTQRKP